MDENKKSIDLTRKGFEESYKEGSFYDKQTKDDFHLESILEFVDIKPRMRILDIWCGTGYLTFPMAMRNAEVSVVGLDIVANTINRNIEQAKNQRLTNLQFISYDGERFPFEDESFDSQIRFPKKKATANGFEEVIAKHDKSIIDSYQIEMTTDEIWVTEEVNNILFIKG